MLKIEIYSTQDSQSLPVKIENIYKIIAHTSQGEIGILSNHDQLLTEISFCKIFIDDNYDEQNSNFNKDILNNKKKHETEKQIEIIFNQNLTSKAIMLIKNNCITINCDLYKID